MARHREKGSALVLVMVLMVVVGVLLGQMVQQAELDHRLAADFAQMMSQE